MDFYALTQQCVPHADKHVVAGITKTESEFNPFAIGVVKGWIKQPKNYAEAVRAVEYLRRHGKNFSVGLTQVNKINFKPYGVTAAKLFDPCTNLKIGVKIYDKCFARAKARYPKQSYHGHMRLAFSCYYSGNFRTGFRRDFPKQKPYVTKVWNNYLSFKGYKQSQRQPIVRNKKGGVYLANLATQLNSQPYRQAQHKPMLINTGSTNDSFESRVANAVGEEVDYRTNNQKRPAPAPEKNDIKKQGIGDVFAAPTPDIFN